VQLSPQIERLFCSELCRQTADLIRYWRGISRDGRIENPDVKTALRTRVALLLAGGYPEQARRLSSEIRQQVWERGQGLCCQCGNPGQEIDHIKGDSPLLSNLQLLCSPCHQRKTAAQMVPASAQHQRMIEKLRCERVAPDEPVLLCDDRDQWATIERRLRKERRQRLLEELAEYGYERSDFRGYSWAEMWDEVESEWEDADDAGGWTPDDDSGYGPYSYFAHAMAKDD
jgi:5-methylcytosine-specific restriction endonuclease McrA